MILTALRPANYFVKIVLDAQYLFVYFTFVVVF